MGFNNLPPILNDLADSFADKNWQDENWSQIIYNIKELINAFDEGVDLKSGVFIPNLIAKEASKLMYLKNHYPIHDDRNNRFKSNQNLKIGLDIDEVVADFIGHYNNRYNIKDDPKYWHNSYKMEENLAKLVNDKEFWLTIPKLRDIPFEPEIYCTSRSIPADWTREWLELNQLPCRPVISIPFGESKLEHLLKAKIDIFVDDKIQTFIELNNNGIFTYLMDSKMNSYFNAGYKRIYDLNII